MPKIVKKKKKVGGGFGGGGPRARETSTLRPYANPRWAPCMDACPAGNDCRAIVTIVAQAEKLGEDQEKAFEEAFYALAETNPLPAVMGRVCPHPCEASCNRAQKDGAVGINKTERFLGDWALERGLPLKRTEEAPRGKKVAVVGSGPAGLSCAYQLARLGYAVTVFEAFSRLGGMLTWGIPPYRLPRTVLDAEITRIAKLGVEFKTGVKIGTDISLDTLKTDFDAIYVAIGAHKGYKLGVEGEDAPNVMTGAEFLKRIYAGEKIDVGNDVVVIGGGNTAIDAASVCRRLGANTTILYRRTEAEMPAIAHEIQMAKEDGISIELLAAPVGVKVENGRAVSMTCIRMELGEPDASGRRSPVPIAGSEYERPASFIIPSIAQEPDFAGFEGLREGRDWIKVDQKWLTKLDGVWAGGDAAAVRPTGLATIAIGHGRLAANAIDAALSGREWKAPPAPKVVASTEMKIAFYGEAEPLTAPVLPVEERIHSMEAEVAGGFSVETVIAESRRCMSCGKCFQCETCYLYCQDQAVQKGAPGEPYTYIFDKCQGCKKCAEECPCAFLEMR
jgi:NADPH-dependent glutamate synthase beta subunit-like oxidoreductase